MGTLPMMMAGMVCRLVAVAQRHKRSRKHYGRHTKNQYFTINSDEKTYFQNSNNHIVEQSS